MSEKRTFVLSHIGVRKLAAQCIAEAPAGYHVTIRPPTRNLDQNAKMWVMLSEVSKQVEWYGQRLTPEDWKHIFSASLKKRRAVPGLDGGFVILGARTSQMSIREMSELIELISAFGVERGVRFAEPA